MKRATCIICRKKRYLHKLEKIKTVIIEKVHGLYNENGFVCKSNKYNYSNLSDCQIELKRKQLWFASHIIKVVESNFGKLSPQEDNTTAVKLSDLEVQKL